MAEELIEGIDFYYNEDGYCVLTELYHIKKGFVVATAVNTAPFNMKRYPNQNVQKSYWPNQLLYASL